jgi:hypothetical protein
MQGSLSELPTKELASPFSLGMATLYFTDPGVARGVEVAMHQSTLFNQGNILSELAFFNKLNAHPEISGIVSEAYTACVNANSTLGWAKAIRICQKDVEDGEGGLSFQHISEFQNIEGNNNDGKVILLTEYIFSNSPGGQELKEFFQSYIGDMSYVLDGTDVSNPVTKIQYTIVPPTVKPLAEFVREDRTQRVYDSLMLTLYKYCNYMAIGSAVNPIIADNPGAADQSKGLEQHLQNVFWFNKGYFTREERLALSAEGAPFNHKIAEAIFKKIHETNSNLTCDNLNPFDDRFILEYSQKAITSKDRVVNEGIVIAYNYASSVAALQVMAVISKIEGFIRESFSGSSSNESFVRGQAINMLFVALNGEMPTKQKEKLLVELKDFVDDQLKGVSQGRFSNMYSESANSKTTGGSGTVATARG